MVKLRNVRAATILERFKRSLRHQPSFIFPNTGIDNTIRHYVYLHLRACICPLQLPETSCHKIQR